MSEWGHAGTTGRAVRVLWWIVAAGAVALCAVGWKVYDAWRHYEAFVPGAAELPLLPGHDELVACASGLSVVAAEADGFDEFGLRYGAPAARDGEPWLVSFGRSLAGERSAERPSWVARVVVGDADLVARTGRRREWAVGLEPIVDADFTVGGPGCELVRLRRAGEEVGFAVVLRLRAEVEREWSLAVVGCPLTDPTALRELVRRVAPALERYRTD